MKKIFAALLAAAMLLTLCACGQKNDAGEKEISPIKMGDIDDIYDFHVVAEHIEKNHKEKTFDAEWLKYPNLSTVMLALEKGEITMVALNQSVANYIDAQNDKFELKSPERIRTSYFSMLTTDTNTELYDLLDSGIKQLKADGTLDKLIEEDLKAYITSDPTPAELPKFDGAKTYKIAVTGDMPPMDFVTADGKAAGFNVALLSEIANIAQVNFELVTMDSGARLTSLASGAVDAVFWTVSLSCPYCGEVIETAPEGTLRTEGYFSDDVAFLTLKQSA